MLEGVLKQRNNTPVNLEQANVRTEIGTCTFYVSFPGFYVRRLGDAAAMLALMLSSILLPDPCRDVPFVPGVC